MSAGEVETRDVLARAAELAARREPYVLATVVWTEGPTSVKAGARAVVTADGSVYGWIGGGCSEPVVVREARRALADGTPRLLHLAPADRLPPERGGMVVAPIGCASEGELEVFVEPHVPVPRIVIVGGAPVAATLAELARTLEFDVELVEPGRGDGDLDLEQHRVGPSTFVVVATAGRYDEAAVEDALAAGAEYVALVASRKRAAAVLDTLGDAGVPDDDLARVRAPAGLDLGSIEHREIAVAVLAEIVREKAARKGWGAAGPSLAGPGRGADAGTAEQVGDAGELVSEEAVDPVCGMSVDVDSARHTARWEDRTYYFCCDSCRRRFESEPERYVTPARS